MNTSPARKVMVVDDEHEVVDLIRDILTMLEYEAIATTQWTEALDALEHEHPDLMLLDLNMPTIDGRALLKFMREQGYDVPVIVVSGYITDDIRDALSPLGVRAFVNKPFEVRTLTGEIAAVLDSAAPASSRAVDAIVKPPDAAWPSEPVLETPAPISGPPPVQIPEPAAPADHSPGILAPRSRRRRRSTPPPAIPSSGNLKRNLRILAILALICMLVTGFIVIAAHQTPKQAKSPEELLRDR